MGPDSGVIGSQPWSQSNVLAQAIRNWVPGVEKVWLCLVSQLWLTRKRLFETKKGLIDNINGEMSKTLVPLNM